MLKLSSILSGARLTFRVRVVSSWQSLLIAPPLMSVTDVDMTCMVTSYCVRYATHIRCVYDERTFVVAVSVQFLDVSINSSQ